MDPLIGLAGSIGSTIVSSMFSDKQSRQARQFAQEQALQNQELQRQNWETALREGAARQVAGMKSAGLNPAMMQGGAPATPPLTSSPGTVVNPNPVSVPDFGRTLNESELTNAQSELLNSQTEGQRNTNSKFLETWNNTMTEIKAHAEEMFANALQSNKRVEEIDQNIKLLSKSVDHLSQQIEESKQKVNESKARENFTNNQAKTWNSFIRSEIRRNAAQAGLLFGQNAREGQMLLFNMSNSSALADYYDNNSAAIRLQNQWNEFLMSQDMKFMEWKNWIGLGTQVLNSIGDNFYKVASGISSFVPFTSHSYSSGVSPLGYNFGYSTTSTQRRTFKP